jgi:hypothetical protein
MTAEETGRDAERHPSVPADATLQGRKEIPATCQLDQGPVEIANLAVSKYEFADLAVSKNTRVIVFDPHVPGACIMSVDDEGARKLRDMLTAWLPGPMGDAEEETPVPGR